MKRTQIFLTVPQLKALKAQAKGTGLSVAELIRRAIDEVYATREKPRVSGWRTFP